MNLQRPRGGLRRWFLLALAAWPGSAHAIFGVGDIVYDPANVAQTINLLNEARQEYDRLGNLLGVSTQQFDQLVILAAALGNATEAAAFASAATPAQLQSMVQTIPGLEAADLARLFRGDGEVDAFSGLSLSEWTAAIQQPDLLYRGVLVSPAAERVGSQQAPSPQAYVQWFSQLAPEDQFNSGSQIAADVSGVLAADWLAGARTRRTNLQALAAASHSAESASAAAKTVSDQGNAQGQLTARTNQILLEAATQNLSASEAAVRSGGVQNRLLEAAAAERRDTAEMMLDASE